MLADPAMTNLPISKSNQYLCPLLIAQRRWGRLHVDRATPRLESEEKRSAMVGPSRLSLGFV